MDPVHAEVQDCLTPRRLPRDKIAAVPQKQAVRFDDPLWGVEVAVAQLQSERTAQGLDHRIKNFRSEVDPRVE